MTPTQKAALLALAEAGEQTEEPKALRGTGWAYRGPSHPPRRADFWRRGSIALVGCAQVWRLTPAGQGAVEALRAGARVETEPMQRELPLGQRRLL